MPPKVTGPSSGRVKQTHITSNPTHAASKSLHANTRKTAARQPISIPERLKRLFTSLCAQIDGGHFSNAVKTCDKILRIEPNDKDALQTKLFLLLQTEQYDAALSIIGENSIEHAFERTYSLYRLHHEPEAIDGLKIMKEGNSADERGALHLEAQLNYRRCSYQAAFDLYTQLLDTAEPQSEEHSDILTNLTAAQKHLDFINTEFLHALDALPTTLTTGLETNPPPSQPVSSVAAALASSSSGATSGDDPAPRPKKVRKSRVPKGIVPGVTPAPDPERWLKKSERSTFGQGNRKRRGGGGGATQGSTAESGPVTASVSSHNVKSGGGGKGKKRK